jgi:hypothetical protein
VRTTRNALTYTADTDAMPSMNVKGECLGLSGEIFLDFDWFSKHQKVTHARRVSSALIFIPLTVGSQILLNLSRHLKIH